jgi:hypothetical protein
MQELLHITSIIPLSLICLNENLQKVHVGS